VAVWEKGEVHTGVWRGDLRQRDHLEDFCIDMGITLTRIFKKCCGGMDWIDLAEDRGRGWAFVNAVMNFRVP
jgi:hypothetical protein